jgi:hypothetical protein
MIENAQIAAHLGLSPDTVVEYLKALGTQRFIQLDRWQSLPLQRGRQPLAWRVQILKH